MASGDEPVITVGEADAIAARIYADESPNLKGTPSLKGDLFGLAIQVYIASITCI